MFLTYFAVFQTCLVSQNQTVPLSLIKLQAFYFQFATFIKNETTGQVPSCEFWEIFKNTFFYRTAPRDCFCTFNVVEARFLIFCILFTKFRCFTNILPKSINLVSLESCYQVGHHFNKEIMLMSLKMIMSLIMSLKMIINLLNVLSKKATIWIFSKLQFFLLTDINLLFRKRNSFKACNARLGTVGNKLLFYYQITAKITKRFNGS